MNANELCLCASQLNYADCCGLYHNHFKNAPTAEALMRSRFTAYAMQNADYLMSTWDKTTCPKTIDFSKEVAQWLRLEIIATKKGGVKDLKGMVEFRAYFLVDGEESVMSEASRFIKNGGRWFYLNGVVKSVGNSNKTDNQGRNAACSCGSGKKFKRCCGK